ncbi:MAG: hypothetical protein KHX55_06975 [Proteobacteria bacterium]|nr:hypothetical protein [Pseudomonadota bacterium]
MKTKILVLAACAAAIAAGAEARVISIQDWDGSHTSRSTSGESEVVRCAEACPGYSISVTACNAEENMVLEACPVKGCRYYYRCSPAPVPQN